MADTEEKTALLCGFGKREITPPLGTPIMGYYKPRYTQGVIDPLFIRAALFRDGDKSAVIISAELCMVEKEWTERVREKIAKTFDIDFEAVLINASHTHTGPLVVDDTIVGDIKADPGFTAFVEAQVFCAVSDAVQDLAPARLFTAETQAKGISFVRRYRMKDGRFATNPAPSTADQIDGPVGEADETLRLLIVRREGADDIYMVNFGTHADTVGGSCISADWPGYLCTTLEAAIPGSKCMFLLGAQGDVNHFTPYLPNRGRVMSEKHKEDLREKAAHARYMGRVLAGHVLQICDRAEEIGNEGIVFATAEMRLPTNRITEGLEEAQKLNELYLTGDWKAAGYSQTDVAGARRLIRLYNAPPYFTFTANALRIGDFVLVAGPGEAFTDIGRRTYAASPFKHTMVCCMTNDYGGYIATSNAYGEGGYEASTSNFKQGADDAYVEAMVTALQNLKEK
ncbi:MAG: neutral/alkaline non-lysosomal ceramidase N-terminal domain-containing protein [Oscillospiraceae bacterium]|nr:neutral/alkaline non-lysosomal ceramidase N-terminal domain-containing protein [Oscillospiraceae bacterium]